MATALIPEPVFPAPPPAPIAYPARLIDRDDYLPKDDSPESQQLREQLVEVVDGKLEVKSMNPLSNVVAGNLGFELTLHTRATRAGTVLIEGVYVLDAERPLIRQPDVSFVSATRWPLDKPFPYRGSWQIVPDIAVEVISPSNIAEAMHSKVSEYFHYGVQEVWLIYPEARVVHAYRSPRQIDVFEAADALHTPLLPGWSVTVNDLCGPLTPEAAPPVG